MKKVLKYALSLVAAVVMLYFSFRKVQWAEFIAQARVCNWAFIILAMAASILAFFFRSQRWRLLIKPFDPKIEVLTTFNGVNIGYLANFVFPRIGEFIRCGFISERSRKMHKDDPENAVSYDKTLGTVLLSRTWDVMVIFILLAILLACRWEMFGEFFTVSMFEPFKQRFNISFGWVVLALAVVAVGTLTLIWSLRTRSKACHSAVRFIKGMLDGFKSCMHMRGKGAFIGYTLLLWAMYWLMSMCIVWAMPQLEGLQWVDALFICLAGSVAWMVPVPGGFGAYHGIVALALSTIYAASWDNSLLYATLNHEAQTITMVLCGIISYIIEIIRK